MKQPCRRPARSDETRQPLRVGAANVGVLAHDGAVGFACIFEKRRIRRVQLRSVTDYRDVVSFAAECRYDCWRNVFVNELPHASGLRFLGSIEVVWPTGNAASLGNRVPLGFDCPHLVGMVVVVGERAVDVSDVEMVVGGDLFGRPARVDHATNAEESESRLLTAGRIAEVG